MSYALALSVRDVEFVEHYAVNGNAAAAARAVGLPAASGYRMLQRQSVRLAIDDARARMGERIELTNDQLIAELIKIVLSDPGEMFADDGSLLPIHEMSDSARSSIAAIEVEAIVYDGVTVGTLKKVKRWDRLKAIEMLAKIKGLLRDTMDVNVNVEIAAAIEQGRNRISQRDKDLAIDAAPVMTTETIEHNPYTD